MNKLGDLIRANREEKEMLQRHLAAELDIDVAYLSKMERGEKTAKREHLNPLAKIFNLNVEELIAFWYADQLFALVRDENQALEALKLAEEAVKQLKSNNKK